MKRAERQSAGFTLIEVVGAVAIVGIVFLILSTATFQGIAAEATAQRLLEASLVADDALAEVEVQMLMSLPIEMDSAALGDIDGDGLAEYEVVLDVAPYDPTSGLSPAGDSLTGAALVAPRGPAPGAGATGEAAMQRVRIDVFLANEYADPDEDEFPLTSRTTYVLETATVNLLAPSRDAPDPTPAVGDSNDFDEGDFDDEEDLDEEDFP